MVQVEAVMKMLDPEFSARAISAKRRNAGNPWFKRGTLCKAVIDILRRAERPMTADDICKALVGREVASGHGEEENNLRAAILAALRKRDGGAVAGEGAPARVATYSRLTGICYLR
jgi:hypothetical protein